MTISLAYLGPQGTNSETAALAFANWFTSQKQETVNLLDYPSIALALRSVARSEAALAVIPIENSIGGTVSITLDTLWELDNLKILWGLTLPITHGLFSFSRDFDSIKTVYSHPQALAQCQRWLETFLPQVKLIATNSTTEALQFLKGDSTAAAIASPRSARLYEIPLLSSPIEDNPDNCTRFWVVGLDERNYGNHLSLAFSLPQNIPGVLVQTLEIFARRGINLSKIESRPTKRSLGEYIFFIDLEGKVDDSIVQTALSELSERTEILKIFGNYDFLPISIS
jgi:prephenate dehydratase